MIKKKIYESRVELSRKKVPHVYRFNLSKGEKQMIIYLSSQTLSNCWFR